MAVRTEQTAMLIIDMQNGFIEPDSVLCVAGAKASLPYCARALAKARELGLPLFYLRREYDANGINVEAVRYAEWLRGGKPISAVSMQPNSLAIPELIAPRPEDSIITKPRFSAFLGTDLDERLQLLNIDTLVIIGTTTPNCIRATCFDALSLRYNVVVIEDCTSSQTPEVQKANISDLASINAQIVDTDTFCKDGLRNIRNYEAEHREAIERVYNI